MNAKRSTEEAPAKAGANRKKKPADTASIEFRFADGTATSQPLIEIALNRVRQWVDIERLPANTPSDLRARASAQANLRKVVELAINAEIGLFVVTEGGRKGGRVRPNTKSAAILAEASKRPAIGTGEILAIARKTGATVRTVRDTLAKNGKYTPQKKNGN